MEAEVERERNQTVINVFHSVAIIRHNLCFFNLLFLFHIFPFTGIVF